ncbi:MAG: family 16 glycosylhydrolase [Bacteroidia bacterium]|nr:family 16 glycosylhydrolase [Bacteroidia bacterium]
MKPKSLAIFCCLIFALISCDNTPDPEPETKPFVRVTGGTSLEGNTNSFITFTVALTDTYSKDVTVAYRTQDGTAVAGEDYEFTSGTLTIASGQTEATVNVTIIGDEVRESNETFEMILEDAVNAEIIGGAGFGNITNDDFGITFGGKDSPTSYPGYTLKWADEFEGSSLNETDWTFEIGTGSGGWGNQELQYYRKENTSLESGNLVIEARAESFGGSNYTSSRIITQGKQTFKYGRIDIRAVLPKGQGLWPALWMLGQNFSTVGWPACGEIDIMEMVGGAGKENTVHGTVHWDNNGSYASYGKGTTKSSGTFAEAYHVYSIIWDEAAIRWLVDDVQYNVIDIRPSGLSEFREEFFFIFNVAVGGIWPGSPDGTTTFPQQMLVDYVRVFEKN